MKTKLIILAALASTIASVLISAAADWKETLTPPAEKFQSSGRNEYFILEPGYQLVLEGKEGGKKTVLTITVLEETKKIGDVETRVVEEREVADGKLAELSRNYFAVGVTSSNVYYFGEDVDVYDEGKVTHEGSWQEGVGDAKHGLAVPAVNHKGDHYYQERAPKVAMDRAETLTTGETVTTPAGKFEHCLKVRETTPLESGTEYKLYAPGIGIVVDGDLKLVKAGFVKK